MANVRAREPANARAGGQKRAKWVSKEVIKYRRENKLCLRCGRDGHMIRECAYLPAQSPSTLKVQQTRVDRELAQPEDDDDDDVGASSSPKLGKE